MRDTFIAALTSAARSNDEIVLIVGDLGYGVVEPFQQEFPDRFFNAGVAEQNMAGLASGLAAEGRHVFLYSIANFPTFRCAEQIRNDIDYPKHAVTIVAVGGGVVYGNLGYSHHAIQDFALMRSMPNTLIAAPGDIAEVNAVVEFLVRNPQPSYLRLGRKQTAPLHASTPNTQPGGWVSVAMNHGVPLAIVTTGGALQPVSKALAMAPELASQVAVFSLPMWGGSHKDSQKQFFDQWPHILTVEDHCLDGGFWSWMAEAAMVTSSQVKLSSLHLSDVHTRVGSQDHLEAVGGLGVDAILKKITQSLERG